MQQINKYQANLMWLINSLKSHRLAMNNTKSYSNPVLIFFTLTSICKLKSL